MPSTFEPVNVPADLSMPDYTAVEEVPETEPRVVPVRALVALLLICLGIIASTVGFWWWVHPGAGLAILGLTTVGLGVLVGFSE